MNETDKKLYNAVKILIGSWALVRGVVEASWDEFKFKKLTNLKNYIDCTKYQFHKMTNSELEKAMVDLLFHEITS